MSDGREHKAGDAGQLAYEGEVALGSARPEDFDSPETIASLAKAGNMGEKEFVGRFRPLTRS